MNCPPPGTIAGEAKTGTEGGAGVVFTIVAGEDGLVVLGGPAEAGGGGAPRVKKNELTTAMVPG